jgi:hypothetical protein
MKQAGLSTKLLMEISPVGKILSDIERNIIIAMLSAEHILLHFVLYPKDAEPFAVRFVTGYEGVEVSPRGIITLRRPETRLVPFIGKDIIVVFHFQKLTLSFIAPLSRTIGALEIDIPIEITRLTETPHRTEPATVPLRFAIPEKPSCGISYLTLKNSPPLSLVFVSDRIVALGTSTNSFQPEKTNEYAIELICQTGQFNRSVFATCYVAEVYTLAESGKSSAICVLTNLKAEDHRFLFEKLDGISNN